MATTTFIPYGDLDDEYCEAIVGWAKRLSDAGRHIDLVMKGPLHLGQNYFGMRPEYTKQLEQLCNLIDDRLPNDAHGSGLGIVRYVDLNLSTQTLTVSSGTTHNLRICHTAFSG